MQAVAYDDYTKSDPNAPVTLTVSPGYAKGSLGKTSSIGKPFTYKITVANKLAIPISFTRIDIRAPSCLHITDEDLLN